MATLTATLTLEPSSANAQSGPRIDLRVLVLDDGSGAVDALAKAMEREGVPHTTVDLDDPSRPTIDAGFLADATATPQRAKYQAVVLPTNEPARLDRPGEREALAEYQRTYGIRQVDAYTWPSAALGLSEVTYSGSGAGATASATTAGLAQGFGYLDGPVPLDQYGWLYVAQPVAGASFTSLVDVQVGAASGSLMGVYTHPDGREELVITGDANEHQLHSRALSHGIITWATRGVHLGMQRSYFTVHVDDVFLPDDRWSIDGNCTVGDGCPEGITAPEIRMTADDVAFLQEWQTKTGLKLDLVFNAGGSAQAIEANGSDPLTNALLADPTQFSWINHTYEHPYLGCDQVEDGTSWRCATDANGGTIWMSQAELTRQIAENQRWAREHNVPMDPSELVTGEHSGLRVDPQQPTDNPNLAPALTATGIEVIASDNSRETQQRMIGSAITLPRYPMNIFYNVATKAEQVDEYNWIYTSAANGGSGICDIDPNSTCIAPLDLQTGFDAYIVPLETSIALNHVVGNDPRPHFAHQSNLTEDRILYPVVDEVVSAYRAMYADNSPLLQPTMTEAAELMARQEAWDGVLATTPDAVEAYTVDGALFVTSSIEAMVPVTAPLGATLNGAAFGDSYGGEQSGWVSVDPSTTPPTTTPPTTTPPDTTPPTTTPPDTTTPTTPPTTTTPTTPPTTTPPVKRSGYWMVGAKGTVYAFGDAKHLGNANVGGRSAVDIEPTPTFNGYWVVDDGGTVHKFGDAGHFGNIGVQLQPGEKVTSLSATASGQGYWLFTSRGRAVAKGDAVLHPGVGGHRDMTYVQLKGPVLDSVSTGTAKGYYMVGSDGGIFTFGDAAFYGSMGATRLVAPVNSMAADPDGKGYWLVAGDGGVFSFQAPFHGSMGGWKLNKPVVGMVPYGRGYLLVASDGGIFTFSDRKFHGSLGNNPPTVPVVAVAALDEG